ncbi:hypothetical protein [Butyrivibrio sp. AC2005]|uniref:hypothetical protein n=1 Tax=Butyrivibrio sp. AC2005 TaxID=1280672 RepID=UPI0018CA1807|nr:hypothetical protein [Butyrivibrio sp. AC2005]
MSAYVKPVQPTPNLSGKYAQKIVQEALSKPSSVAIKRNEHNLKLRKKIVKK